MKNEIKVIANLPIKGMDAIKRCYSGGGISPSLTTMQGGQREPKVIVRKTQNKLKTRSD